MIGKAWKFCWNKLCAGLLSSNGWPHSLKSKPKSPSKWCLCSHPKLHPWENWHIHRYPTLGKGKSSSNMPYQGDMFMARHNYSIWSSHLRLDLQGNGGLGEQGWGHCYRLPRPLTTRLEISSRGRISVHWSYLQAPWVPKVGGRDPGPHRVRISDSRIGQEKMQENNRKHPLTREPPPVISRVITPLKGVTAPVIHLWRHFLPNLGRHFWCFNFLQKYPKIATIMVECHWNRSLIFFVNKSRCSVAMFHHHTISTWSHCSVALPFTNMISQQNLAQFLRNSGKHTFFLFIHLYILTTPLS